MQIATQVACVVSKRRKIQTYNPYDDCMCYAALTHGLFVEQPKRLACPFSAGFMTVTPAFLLNQ